MQVSETDRTRLRKLQDKWLALSVVQSQIRNFGEGERITGSNTSPTFQDVRTLVLPEWEQWFKDFFQ